jgi:hypothetical protein
MLWINSGKFGTGGRELLEIKQGDRSTQFFIIAVFMGHYDSHQCIAKGLFFATQHHGSNHNCE